LWSSVCDIIHSGRWTMKFRKNTLTFFFRTEACSSQLLARNCYDTKLTIWLVTIRKSYLAKGRHFTALSLLKFPLFNSWSNILLSRQKFLVIFCLSPEKVRHEIRSQEIKQVFVWTWSVHKLLISNLTAAGKQDRENNMYGCAQQDLKPIVGEFMKIIIKMSIKNSGKWIK